MRKGWQAKKLGELCDIELGRTPARANASFWDEKRETNNVWLSIADLLKADDNVVVDSREYVSDKGAEICKLVPKGTLLVSFKLTLGRLAFAGRDLFTNEAIAALTIFDERELSKEFLFYFLHFFDWIKAAENDVKLKGMTLNKAKLKEMDVHFPKTLAEQQRIVGVLDEAFASLATAQANAQKNHRNARALFESHLQSVFSQRGKGWVEKTIGEVCDFRGGGTPSKAVERYWKGKIPWVSPKDMKSEVVSDSIDHISQEAIDASATSLIPKGAVLMVVRSGILARTVPLSVTGRELTINQDLKALCPKTLIESRFLYSSLESKMPELLSMVSRGATVHRLQSDQIRTLRIFLPPKAEQHGIIERIDSMREETQRLATLYERKLASLEALKRSLLHQAFTGNL